MNWTLVALLAIPGVMMGLLSVRGHTRGIEPYLWLVLALFATLVIARTAGQRYFLHGLSVGIAWGVLNGLVAAALFPVYARHNPEVMQNMQAGDAKLPPQAMFLMSAPPDRPGHRRGPRAAVLGCDVHHPARAAGGGNVVVIGPRCEVIEDGTSTTAAVTRPPPPSSACPTPT
jgi:hypothetical protein